MVPTGAPAESVNELICGFTTTSNVTSFSCAPVRAIVAVTVVLPAPLGANVALELYYCDMITAGSLTS